MNTRTVISKSLLFTSTIAAAALTSGCGHHSDGQPPQDPGTVQAEAVGKFTALYTGTCEIQAQDRTYTNCQTKVSIQQTDNSLTVKTRFFVTPSVHDLTPAQEQGVTRDTFIITGNHLQSTANGADTGYIGRHGFTFTRDGQAYEFKRLYPAHYQYSGTFKDVSRQVVFVKGDIVRGSPVQPADGVPHAQMSPNRLKKH